jgi:hypothetical protein
MSALDWASAGYCEHADPAFWRLDKKWRDYKRYALIDYTNPELREIEATSPEDS